MIQVPPNGFKYNVYAHPVLQSDAWHHQNENILSASVSENDYTCYEYPYAALKIQSHVQSHYVIFHIGNKLRTSSKIMGLLPSQHDEHITSLHFMVVRCVDIYEYWIKSWGKHRMDVLLKSLSGTDSEDRYKVTRAWRKSFQSPSSSNHNMVGSIHTSPRRRNPDGAFLSSPSASSLGHGQGEKHGCPTENDYDLLTKSSLKWHKCANGSCQQLDMEGKTWEDISSTVLDWVKDILLGVPADWREVGGYCPLNWTCSSTLICCPFNCSPSNVPLNGGYCEGNFPMLILSHSQLLTLHSGACKYGSYSLNN